MMDVLLVRQHSIPQIQYFLSAVFECAVDRVKVFSVEAFNFLNEEMDDFSVDCICVLSPIDGDVAQLLQLYRYKISNSDAVRRTVEIALQNKVHCYIPGDSSDGWIYVGDGDLPKCAQQIENDEDNCFAFKLI